MKKLARLLTGAAVAATLALAPTSASAKVAAVYASGMGGLQNTGARDTGLGLMLGARLLIFDGYLDYTNFGQNESVSRGILGLRGGVRSRDFRLRLRGRAGALPQV